ncbi:MAG: DUF4410 domain-containing protein [Woeseiaceae bacterium]
MNAATKTSLILIAGVLTFSSVEGSDKGVDHSKLHGDMIAKDTAIVVHAFDSSKADLGSFKHIDTAKRAAETAPHLVAVDIVDTLRGYGFTKVSLSDSAKPAGDGLQLVGTFTEINPGSQSTRVWIGFGAGASKVCISGTLQTASGVVVGEFKDCEKGLGWGNSGDQTEGEAARIGANVGQLINSWAR